MVKETEPQEEVTCKRHSYLRVVFVPSTCVNKISQPGLFADNRNSFFIVWDIVTSKTRHQMIFCLLRVCPPSEMHFPGVFSSDSTGISAKQNMGAPLGPACLNDLKGTEVRCISVREHFSLLAHYPKCLVRSPTWVTKISYFSQHLQPPTIQVPRKPEPRATVGTLTQVLQCRTSVLTTELHACSSVAS